MHIKVNSRVNLKRLLDSYGEFDQFTSDKTKLNFEESTFANDLNPSIEESEKVSCHSQIKRI